MEGNIIGAAGFAQGLNKVRSWRPEQFSEYSAILDNDKLVSMKSGLGDRNNFLLTTDISPLK